MPSQRVSQGELAGVEYIDPAELTAPPDEDEIQAAKELAARTAADLRHSMPRTLGEHRFQIALQEEATARAREPIIAARLAAGEECAALIADTKALLVRALREQGRLAEALELDPDNQGILNGLAARDHDDQDFDCGCEDQEAMDLSVGRRVKFSRFARKSVVNAKYGGEVSLWICSGCGFLNMSPFAPPNWDDRPIRTELPGDKR